MRWELQPDFAPLLDALLKSPGEMVKESPVKQVTVHQLGEKTFYIKRYLHHAVPLRSWKFFFKPTQARQEWELAQQLEARKIPIVRHVGLGERRTWSGVQESILITEGFDGLPLIYVPGVDPAAVQRFVEHMHDQGVLQEDLHPGNLLVDKKTFELRLVDLHGTQVLPQLSAGQRETNMALLRVFLPITVKIYGQALVATAAVPTGSVLNASDLVQAEVDLAEDTSIAVADANAAVGRTLARPLMPGQSLRLAHLKPRQWFAAGETVRVSSSGPGFSMASEGQALTHGIEGQLARVRTEGGRVLTGQPVAEHRMELAL